MNDIQQRIAAMSRAEISTNLLELVTALHAEDTDRAYKVLRDAGLEDDDDDEVHLKWHNFYKCPKCGTEWEDEWDCQCDDDCPECGNRHISPHHSEEIDPPKTTGIVCPKCQSSEFNATQSMRGSVDVIAVLNADGTATFVRNPTDDGAVNTDGLDCGDPEGPFTCVKCGHEMSKDDLTPTSKP